MEVKETIDLAIGNYIFMTDCEHVDLYAAIKDVNKSMVKEAAASKLAEIGLSKSDRNRLSAGYNGGIKHKHSVACATIGQPQIMFLNPPSTGMDPVIRRALWKDISILSQEKRNIVDKNQTPVILTNHSMENGEALCSRTPEIAKAQFDRKV